MPSNIDEFSKQIRISLGAIVLWTTIIITTTFSASTIYWKFNALHQDHNADTKLLTEQIVTLDNRVTKVNIRNDDQHKDQEFRVRDLESKVAKFTETQKEFYEFKEMFLKEYNHNHKLRKEND